MRIQPEIGDEVIVNSFVIREEGKGSITKEEIKTLIVKECWEDYEVGWRYIGVEPDNDKLIYYFGEFEVVYVNGLPAKGRSQE